jgi:hypothetical protein
MDRKSEIRSRICASRPSSNNCFSKPLIIKDCDAGAYANNPADLNSYLPCMNNSMQGSKSLRPTNLMRRTTFVFQPPLYLGLSLRFLRRAFSTASFSTKRNANTMHGKVPKQIQGAA